jgi:hypothetical protein
VAVLPRVYVRCIVGRDEVARQRIEATFDGEEEKPEKDSDEDQEEETPDEDE